MIRRNLFTRFGINDFTHGINNCSCIHKINRPQLQKPKKIIFSLMYLKHLTKRLKCLKIFIYLKNIYL